MELLKRVWILILLSLTTGCSILSPSQEKIKTQEIKLILKSIDSEEDVIYWDCYFTPTWYETNNMTIDRCLKKYKEFRNGKAQK